MTSARRATAAACAIAAVALGAGAVVARRAGGLGRGAALAKAGGAAAHLRTTASTVLGARAKALEADVRRGAGVHQLESALLDGVDSATVLDLFESEDWWAPFRARAVALVSGNRLLAVRGDKQVPMPEPSLLVRAQEAGVASAIMVGTHPVLAAIAPIAPGRRGDPTFLMFSSPLEAEAIGSEIGAPVLLSDGQVALSVNGPERAQALLRAAIGKETAGIVTDPSGSLAAATPLLPGLWLWVLQEGAGEAPSTERAWLPFAGGALLFALASLLLWRPGGRDAPPLVAQAVVSARGSPARESPADQRSAPANDTGERKRRGTRPYPADDLGHRPTAYADEESGRRATPGGTPRLAQAAVSRFIPERSRVETGSSSFGRYRLIDRLGEGGMAEIYTAVSHGAEGFRRVFVLKRLRPEIARNRAAVEQFIDEAKLGSSLVHSNIVPVFDFGKVGDEFFMAQEYIIGRDMIRLLERHLEALGRPLDAKLVLYIAHEVLEGLSYAHNQTDASGAPVGLVHRDVSPGNIMLTSRGEVKLADFGIVKGEGRLSTTDVGVVKGNVSFMSPEQARGQVVDARSDLFSLGLVMFYCLASEPLYTAEGTFGQLMVAASGPQAEHRRRLAALPPLSALVLEKALAVAPADRYQTAAEFAAALAPHVAGAKAEGAALMQRLFGEELRREATI